VKGSDNARRFLGNVNHAKKFSTKPMLAILEEVSRIPCRGHELVKPPKESFGTTRGLEKYNAKLQNLLPCCPSLTDNQYRQEISSL